MNGSARFYTFSLTYGVAYMALFLYSERTQSALFRYYPILGEFSRGALPLETAGPAILWYSWLAGALVISTLLALLVPPSLAERLGRRWVWVVPAAMLLLIIVYERRWFY
jgi:hypothetical protein